MPRNYKPDPNKKTYKKYDSNLLLQAVEELTTIPNAKLSVISKKYSIHKSVLYRHSRKIMKPQGGQTALGSETENYLIEYINICAEWGYPLDTMDLRYIVKMYLDKLGITLTKFKNNLPGPDFVQGFLKRHENKISQRICENIKRSRAAISPEIIRKYHEELQKSLDGVPPCNIINYDETNLSDDPGRKKVLMKRGCKYPERVLNHSKVSTSIMMAGTPDGEILPPYVVYKASHLYDTWVRHGPEGTRYNRTSSGWFEGTIFEDWVRNLVIPYFKDKPGKKVLIGDNLSSHLSLELIKCCKSHNIDFVFLPANSTHLTQPLDVAFFRPMKVAWRNILLKWKKSDGRNCGSVPKGCFPKLLNILIEELKPNSKNNIMAGFKKTGIYPANIDELLTRLPQDPRDEEIKSSIDNSVLDLLQEMRYGSINVTEPKKKRKLNIVAGKSVSAEETEVYAENPQPCTSLDTKPSKRQGEGKGKGNGKKTVNNKPQLTIKRKIDESKREEQDNKTLQKENYPLPSTSQGIKNKKQGNGKGKNSIQYKINKDSVVLQSVKIREEDQKTNKMCTGKETCVKTPERFQLISEIGQDSAQVEDITDTSDPLMVIDINSTVVSDNILQETDINSMPFIYFDEDSAEVIVKTDDKINLAEIDVNMKEDTIKESKFKSPAKQCIVIKQEKLDKTHKITKNNIKDLRTVFLQDKLNLIKRNIEPKTNLRGKAAKQTDFKKNYYNRAEEIMDILNEDDSD